MSAKATFAAVPARAIGDQRLSGLHWRVLATIALHDRMSGSRGKGQGCWAGNRTLAAECGCDYSRLSATITDLGRWGYVEREVHPLNKRFRVYRIVYTDDDLATVTAANTLPTGKPSSPDSLRTGKLSTGEIPPTVCDPANEAPETVCRDFEETERFQQGAEVNIFRETENRLGETLKENSAEAASRDDAHDGLRISKNENGSNERQSIGANLAKIQASYELHRHDLGQLQKYSVYLWGVMFENTDRDDRLRAWAARLESKVSAAIIELRTREGDDGS